MNRKTCTPTELLKLHPSVFEVYFSYFTPHKSKEVFLSQQTNFRISEAIRNIKHVPPFFRAMECVQKWA